MLEFSTWLACGLGLYVTLLELVESLVSESNRMVAAI